MSDTQVLKFNRHAIWAIYQHEMARALRTLGYSIEGVRAAIEQVVGPGDPQRARFGHIPFTARAKKVMELSLRAALRMGGRPKRSAAG